MGGRIETPFCLENSFDCGLGGYLSPRGVLRCFLTNILTRRDGTTYTGLHIARPKQPPHLGSSTSEKGEEEGKKKGKE